MIFEKRKRIRKLKPTETEWTPQPDFVEIEHWGEIRPVETTSLLALLIKGLVAGTIGFFIGYYFFLS